MEYSQEQRLNAEVVQRAWDDAQFRSELMTNPIETMEKLTGHKISLPEGQKLVVVDQTDESIVYFNIPQKVDINSLELTEEQLEQVAGGLTPAFVYGFIVGVSVWAATHQ